MTKHKWYKEIIAFANGEIIQFKYKDDTVWSDIDNPSFQTKDTHEYRVKPKVVERYLKVYVDDVVHDTELACPEKATWHNLKLTFEGNKLVEAEVL